VAEIVRLLPGSPGTISVPKRGLGVFPSLHHCRRGQQRPAALIAGREAAARARRISRMRYVVTGWRRFSSARTRWTNFVRRATAWSFSDDLFLGKEENFGEIRNKITFIKGSITDIEIVRKAHARSRVRAPSRGRHFGAALRERSNRTNKINIEGTLNVLVAAKS